jgi:DnaJ-class molecular chaperone
MEFFCEKCGWFLYSDVKTDCRFCQNPKIDWVYIDTTVCLWCSGTGKIRNSICNQCKGSSKA